MYFCGKTSGTKRRNLSGFAVRTSEMAVSTILNSEGFNAEVGGRRRGAPVASLDGLHYTGKSFVVAEPGSSNLMTCLSTREFVEE